MNPKIKGYALGVVAAACYGLNPSFALPLYADGLNADSVLLLRYGLSVPMVAVMMLLSGKGKSFRVPKESILPLAALGILMALSSITLYVSYNYMASGIASTILFVYPILVAVINTVFFREKVSLMTVICILLATGGIFMLYHIEEGETLSLFGTLIVIASSLSYALYLVFVGHRRVRDIDPLAVTFYVLVFGTMLFAGRIAFGISPLKLPTSGLMWADALGIALFPAIISLVCTSRAIQLIGSTPTAILGAVEPVVAVTMGIVFFGEGMTLREALGMLIILSSVSIVIAEGTKKKSK